MRIRPRRTTPETTPTTTPAVWYVEPAAGPMAIVRAPRAADVVPASASEPQAA